MATKDKIIRIGTDSRGVILDKGIIEKVFHLKVGDEIQIEYDVSQNTPRIIIQKSGSEVK